VILVFAVIPDGGGEHLYVYLEAEEMGFAALCPCYLG